MGLAIRPAREGEAGAVLALVKALADYEERGGEVVADEAAIAGALFGPAPTVFCDLAEFDGAPVGFALWFRTYSTFTGRHGVYLEDLFVQPAARGRGIGKALMAHLARRCLDDGCDRLAWSVLTWNAPAISFYEKLGAERVDDWHSMKLWSEAMRRLAARAPTGS